MGWTGQDALIDDVTNNGQFQYDVRFKTISTAQVAAFWTNLGVFSGSEPASAYPGTSLTFVPTDDTWADGAWQHGGDVSTMTKHFLYAGANIVAAAGAPWVLMAVDQVGYVPITSTDVTGTGSRTITMTAIGSSAAKVDRYPNGKGLRAFFSTEVAPTAGGPNLTVFGYNDTAGAAKTCPVTVGFAATPVIGAVPHSGGAATRYAPFLPMAAGSTGISDLTNFTLTGGTAYTGSGQLVLHLVKPLWCIPLPASGIHQVAEFVNALPNLCKIPDGACVQWMLMNTGATTANAPLMAESAHAWG